MSKVCILVPVRDEADALQVVLPQLLQVSRLMTGGAEIVVLDDGSTDGSVDQATKLGVVAHRFSPRGKAPTVRDGFAMALAAGYEFVFVFDGDGQHPPSALPLMLQHLGANVVVKGTRFHPTSPQFGTPLDREMLNIAVRALVRHYTGWDVTDPQCGLIGLRREVLEQVLPLLRWKKEWELEFLLRYSRSRQWPGSPILEIPIPAFYSGLPGAKQVEKYHPGNGHERMTRLALQCSFIKDVLDDLATG